MKAFNFAQPRSTLSTLMISLTTVTSLIKISRSQSKLSFVRMRALRVPIIQRWTQDVNKNIFRFSSKLYQGITQDRNSKHFRFQVTANVFFMKSNDVLDSSRCIFVSFYLQGVLPFKLVNITTTNKICIIWSLRTRKKMHFETPALSHK